MADPHNRAGALRTTRVMLAIGAVLYPAWYLVARAAGFGAYERPGERMALGGLLAVLGALTFLPGLRRRHLLLSYIAAWALVAHTFVGMSRSGFAAFYVTSTLIVLASASAVFFELPAVIASSVWVFALTLGIALLGPPRAPLEVVCGILIVQSMVALSAWRHIAGRKGVEEEARLSAERLRASEEQFRLSFESAPIGISLVSPAGRFLRVNRSFCTLLGYSETEMLTHDFQGLTHPDDRATDQAAAWRLLSGELDLFEREKRYLHKSGRTVDVRVSVTVVRDPAGKPVNFVSQIQDVSAQKSAIIALREAKEAAEHSARTRSEFLANMSHEIRTPMNGIIGMTAIALESPLDPGQRECMEIVRSSASSLMLLLNDILDLSKLEAEKMSVDSAPFALRDCVDGALDVLGARAAEKGLELLCDVAPGVPERLIGDAGRFGQIIANLVGNAVKFTERGSVVVRIEEEARADSGVRLHLSVADSGIGIPPEKLESIFNAFEQADGSTTRKFGGTGLGLTITRRLLGVMSGRIWVESVPGRGSTFHVSVPFGLDAERADPAEFADVAGRRVLIVSQSVDERRILSEITARWGMVPAPASGAATGIRALCVAEESGRPFDLVLVDGAPQMADAVEFAARFHSQRLLRAPPLLLLSASQREDEHARASGFSMVVLKPVNRTRLLGRIRGALAARAPGAPVLALRAPQRSRASKKVLLAEDNEVNQIVAIRLLERRGHVVTLARDGEEAARLAIAGDFGVILMDVQMPKLSGLEATARIRAFEESSRRPRTRIVAVTAHAMSGDAERFLSAGMDGYISKPISSASLLEAVEGGEQSLATAKA